MLTVRFENISAQRLIGDRFYGRVRLYLGTVPYCFETTSQCTASFGVSNGHLVAYGQNGHVSARFPLQGQSLDLPAFVRQYVLFLETL